MYPDDVIQSLVSTWWINNTDRDWRRGRLVLAFVPHVDQVPMTLIAEGREEPTDHNKAKFKLKPLRISGPPKEPKLPVASIPSYEGEVRTVYRAKKRPVLIIGIGGSHVPKELRLGKPKWQISPTLLVAPYYGVDRVGFRTGWHKKLVCRIQRCEYPQYMWDQLPISGKTKESILRLDHILPVGRHHDSLEWTPHCLSNEAMEILEEWITWIITGQLPEDGVLLDVREELLKLDSN
jgi:hypothetical protein